MSFGSGQQGLALYFISDIIFAFFYHFGLLINFGEYCETGWIKEILTLSLWNSAIESTVLVISFCLNVCLISCKVLILAWMIFATVLIWGISWGLKAASNVFVWVFSMLLVWEQKKAIFRVTF